MVKLDIETALVVFKCAKCNEMITVSLKELSVSVDASECELCGIHCTVDLELECTKCGTTNESRIREW